MICDTKYLEMYLSDVILFYDDYHTPLNSLSRVCGPGNVLFVSQGKIEANDSDAEVDLPQGWRAVRINGVKEFLDKYVTKAIKANALYQTKYNLCAALSRPALAEICVRHVDQLETTRLIHGFAGNDQLRFEVSVLSLRPNIQVCSVANLIGSRTRHNSNTFTISDNIWGRSIEAGNLSDAWVSSYDPKETYSTVLPEPVEICIGFEEGIPVSIDGKQASLEQIVSNLNALGLSYGGRRHDLVEDGYVGLKSRAVYIFPAADILINAHADLERFVCTRRQNAFKNLVDTAWTELVYEAAWFDPQRKALEAYIDETNSWVTGEVRLLIGVDGVRVLGRRSKFSHYAENSAIYRIGQDFGDDLLRGLQRQITDQNRLSLCRRII